MSSATSSDRISTRATDRDAIPDAARLASLGCGNPTAVADLHEGETVLDLGSGGGIDVLLSARRVGATGKAFGLDMTDEMLELARANQREAGVENVEFLKGEIEAIPLPDDAVDVVISNCVINLSGDKPQVLREAARVLRPGGRFAVSDVIADPDMDEMTKRDMQQWTGCIAGALTREEFEAQPCSRGLHRHRDPRDPPRARAGFFRDRPRHPACVSDAELQLNDPQTLYRNWEDSQWNPFTIDLAADRAQWQEMSTGDRTLIYWVLASLMVAEERITTKFSGLVGAHGNEEEATFLSTQQVDEARHMQFYARFQDEVVAAPALVASHVERARAELSPAFRQIFDVELVQAHSRLTSEPENLDAKVRFVTLYHLILESTLGLTTYRFVTDFLARESLLAGFAEGYSLIHHDETRHIGYGVWFLRETVRSHPETADSVRAMLRALLPSVAEALRPESSGGSITDRLGVGSDEIRDFALSGLTRRLDIIGVPLSSL